MSAATLEVPVDTVDDARAAGERCTRIELCASLGSHGHTPSLQFVQDVRTATTCPAVVLLRSPALGAPLSERMREHLHMIQACAPLGVEGFAFGELDAAGGFHVQANAELAAWCRRNGCTPCLHRAFDRVLDAELVADMGISRVLCAGTPKLDLGGTMLDARLAVMQRAVYDANGRFEVVACGGVLVANAEAFRAVTPHLHSSCRASAYTTPTLNTTELATLVG